MTQLNMKKLFIALLVMVGVLGLHSLRPNFPKPIHRVKCTATRSTNSNLADVMQSWKSAQKSVVKTLVGSLMFATLATNPFPALADARLNAPTAVGTRVNSDPESLLRYGLPIQSKELRDIQASIENVKLNLKTRRAQFALSDINNAKSLLAKYEAKILAQVPPEHAKQAKETFQRMKDEVVPVIEAIKSETGAGSGSVQERAALDNAFSSQDILAKDLSVLEELLIPDSFQRDIPDEYAALPRLKGRATVSLVLKREDGSPYNVAGVLYDQVKLDLVVDGYNAPLTAGNFVDLVSKGFYTNMKIQRADGFVVQTGDSNPDGPVHGYVPSGAKSERTIPLEVSLRGQDSLLYGSTTEDEGRGGAVVSLPFQAYGALGMARAEFEADSASSQFFFLLFESDLTPAGKNMLDGRYTCFGYTTEGRELLRDVKEGDVIVQAKVTKGAENLVVPRG